MRGTGFELKIHMPSYKRIGMPSATIEDIEKQRYRIKAAWRLGKITKKTRDALLEASKVMGRHKSTWGHDRHESILKRLIMLAWGGGKYDDLPDASLADMLEDKEVTGKIVDWIHAHYANEETNRDMRGALRAFGKLLTNDDPSHKDATPPPSIDWVQATLPSNYDPVPNPANMITWTETREMCEHPETTARGAALLAVAWDAGPRSGELEDLSVGDVSDHDLGKSSVWTGRLASAMLLSRTLSHTSGNGSISIQPLIVPETRTTPLPHCGRNSRTPTVSPTGCTGTSSWMPPSAWASTSLTTPLTSANRLQARAPAGG
jgi:hypothetical protein